MAFVPILGGEATARVASADPSTATPDEIQSAPAFGTIIFESAAVNDELLISDLRAEAASAAASDTIESAASVAIPDWLVVAVDAAIVASTSPAATIMTVSMLREIAPRRLSFTDVPLAANVEPIESDMFAELEFTPVAVHERGRGPGDKTTLLDAAPTERIAIAAHA